MISLYVVLWNLENDLLKQETSHLQVCVNDFIGNKYKTLYKTFSWQLFQVTPLHSVWNTKFLLTSSGTVLGDFYSVSVDW